VEGESQSPTTENDVAIAAIEADKEITIAQIEADARVAVEESYNEARVEVSENESNEQWDMSLLISELQAMKAELQELKQSQQVLTALEVAEQLETQEQAEAMAETIAEELSNSTPQSMSDQTSEMQTVAIEESGAESPVIPPLLEIDKKPIFRLV
jgi:hypothetical protein